MLAHNGTVCFLLEEERGQKRKRELDEEGEEGEEDDWSYYLGTLICDPTILTPYVSVAKSHCFVAMAVGGIKMVWDWLWKQGHFFPPLLYLESVAFLFIPNLLKDGCGILFLSKRTLFKKTYPLC